MSGDDRTLAKIYSNLVYGEKRSNEVSARAQDSQDSEEIARLFEEMIELKISSASGMSLGSAYQTFKHDTLRFAVTNIA